MADYQTHPGLWRTRPAPPSGDDGPRTVRQAATVDGVARVYAAALVAFAPMAAKREAQAEGAGVKLLLESARDAIAGFVLTLDEEVGRG